VVIEIIPKPIEKIPSYQKKLFYFSIFLFLVLPFVYFILTSVGKKSENILSNLEESIAKGKTPEIISLENENLNYQKKIKDISLLLEKHLFPSKIFEFFERNTHPRFSFQKLI